MLLIVLRSEKVIDDSILKHFFRIFLIRISISRKLSRFSFSDELTNEIPEISSFFLLREIVHPSPPNKPPRNSLRIGIGQFSLINSGNK